MSDSDSAEVSSVLSKKQRQWLNGEDPYDSPDRVVRSRIKSRYRQGISDLALMVRSDRIENEYMRQWVRGDSSTTSNDTVSEGLANHGQIEEELLADGMDSALNFLDTFTGNDVNEMSLSDLKDRMREYQVRNGRLEEKWYPRLAVLGAFVALEMGGKTEKQARQWIQHHWPNSEEALEKLQEAEDRGML